MDATKKQIRFGNERNTIRELIRRYIENDVTETEKHSVQRLLQDSEEFRRDYANVENYLSALRSLPRFAPPDRVWRQIERRIDRVSPKRVWFPWYYARPAWSYAAKIIPILFLVAAALGVGNSLKESKYEFVVVDEATGFRTEAESYVVYHDLANEPAPIRESLLAFCTNTGSE
jgi:hypothetical protein